jgi:isopentenyldiphosphate isomerase
MKEILEIYDLNNKLIKTEERDKFYKRIKKEFFEKGKISQKIKSIRLIMMNSDGRIYLQKRSKFKKENAGLYDKTIGGHVLKGETWEMTVIKECAEELGFPAAVLSPKEFKKAIKSTDLNIIGIFKKIDFIPNFQSVRLIEEGRKIIQPFITTFYIGYYDGLIKFKDGESSGIEVFSLDELKKEIKNNPNKFTEDIKFMIKKYENLLKPIKSF